MQARELNRTMHQSSKYRIYKEHGELQQALERLQDFTEARGPTWTEIAGPRTTLTFLREETIAPTPIPPLRAAIDATPCQRAKGG